jgi:exodeoxyribonuclease-5/exodeoxyribonuclease V alpha subunit
MAYSKPTTNVNDLTRIHVRILRNTFWNQDNLYGIYKVEIMGSKAGEDGIEAIEESTITGNFEKKFFYGEEYIMYAKETVHPRYGRQYAVSLVQHLVDTPDRIKSFLLQCCNSQPIVDQLLKKYGGEDLVQRIVDNNVDYSDIKGMKDARFHAMRDKVLENQHMKDIIIGLSKFGITPLQMKRLVERFGAAAIAKIEENPYHLCKIKGIGFARADEVAKAMGFDLESPFRIRECIRFILLEAQSDGQSWLSRESVVAKAQELLEIRPELISSEINNTEDKVEGESIEDVVVIENRVAMLNVYLAELNLSKWLKERNENVKALNIDVEAFLDEMEKTENITFTDEQKQFFYNLKDFGVNFLIGYAGCGKSFLLKFALKIFDRLGMSVLLCAPTGKAAKVMEDYTGRKASTLHRAFGLFGKTEEEEVGEASKACQDDVIVCDEASMNGVLMLSKAIKGIGNHNARIIFIGDDAQLPSVEVGRFLGDCIESGVFHITKLTKVFRQQEGGVLDAATKVRLGQSFVENDFDGKRIYGTQKDMILHCVEPEKVAQKVVDYYSSVLSIPVWEMEGDEPKLDAEGKKIHKRDEHGNFVYKYTVDDVMVLTPQKTTDKGTRAINSAIQSLVNPPNTYKEEVSFGKDVIFREGDRIINRQNNYKAENALGEEVVVFNGEMGTIIKIDKEARKIHIDYGFDTILTSFDALDTILHAYCLTIHKSQGSGFKVVILVIDHSHQFMLNRNLIYTGITRTKQNLVIVGQSMIINRSLKKNSTVTRNSFLKDFLTGTINEA